MDPAPTAVSGEEPNAIKNSEGSGAPSLTPAEELARDKSEEEEEVDDECRRCSVFLHGRRSAVAPTVDQEGTRIAMDIELEERCREEAEEHQLAKCEHEASLIEEEVQREWTPSPPPSCGYGHQRDSSGNSSNTANWIQGCAEMAAELQMLEEMEVDSAIAQEEALRDQYLIDEMEDENEECLEREEDQAGHTLLDGVQVGERETRFIYRGRTLEGHMTMEELGVTRGSIIFMAPSLPGGVDKKASGKEAFIGITFMAPSLPVHGARSTS